MTIVQRQGSPTRTSRDDWELRVRYDTHRSGALAGGGGTLWGRHAFRRAEFRTSGGRYRLTITAAP